MEKIAIVFQNSLDILNPLLTIHEQIYEVLMKHTDLSKGEANERIVDLLGKPGLGCPFKNRCTQSLDICKDQRPGLEYISKNREVACNRGGIASILKADSGQVLFEESPVLGNNFTSRENGIQIVFQDPFSKLYARSIYPG